MRDGRYALVGLAVMLSVVTCKRTQAEGQRKMESAPEASPGAFTLSGEFFELPLPAGWRAHPKQQSMQDFGAVRDPYELIVATQTVDLAKAQASGVSYEEVLRRLAEIRRGVSAQYAADPQNVEPTQSLTIGDIPTLAFRARLSRSPFAGVTQLSVILGVPGLRAGTDSKRPVLTISLYDYNGGSPDDLAKFGRALLAPLQLKRYVQQP
jgi:hypothetical protein